MVAKRRVQAEYCQSQKLYPYPEFFYSELFEMMREVAEEYLPYGSIECRVTDRIHEAIQIWTDSEWLPPSKRAQHLQEFIKASSQAAAALEELQKDRQFVGSLNISYPDLNQEYGLDRPRIWELQSYYRSQVEWAQKLLGRIQKKRGRPQNDNARINELVLACMDAWQLDAKLKIRLNKGRNDQDCTGPFIEFVRKLLVVLEYEKSGGYRHVYRPSLGKLVQTILTSSGRWEK